MRVQRRYFVETIGTDLVRASCLGGGVAPVGKRGSVNTFTAAAGARLKRRCEEIDWLADGGEMIMLSLTWGKGPEGQDLYAVVKEFWRRFKQKFPKAWAVWRCELQRRGVPHYHLLVGGYSWVPFDVLSELWGSVGGGYAWVTKWPDPAEGARYLAKYISKQGGREGRSSEAKPADPALPAAVSLDLTPYQKEGDGLREWGVKRRWGLLSRDCVVWKDRHVREVSRRVYYSLRRVAKRLGQLRKWGHNGFSLRGVLRTVDFFSGGEVWPEQAA